MAPLKNLFKVIFSLGRDINNQKTVNKIRFANSRDWYLFNTDLDHHSLARHPILQNRIDEINYETTAEMEWYLNEKSKSIYLNAKNEFVFGRRKLINEQDLLLAEAQNNRPIFNFPIDNSSLVNAPINNPSLINAQIINPSSSANNSANLSASNLINYSSNNISLNNQNLNNSNMISEIELDKFDCENDNPFEFIDKFEAKYKDTKSKFLKLKKYLPEEEHAFLVDCSYKMRWNNFVEFFLKTYGEKYRLKIRNLDRSKFVIGGKIDLSTFIQKKFELYENHFKGVPIDVVIKQIINSLPDKYARKLFFNLDSTKEDFLERVSFVEIPDSDDEDDEAKNKKIEDSNATNLNQSNVTTNLNQSDVTTNLDQLALTANMNQLASTNLNQSNTEKNQLNTTKLVEKKSLDQSNATTNLNQSEKTARLSQLNENSKNPINNNPASLSVDNNLNNNLFDLANKIDSQFNKFNEITNLLENFLNQSKSNPIDNLIRLQPSFILNRLNNYQNNFENQKDLNNNAPIENISENNSKNDQNIISTNNNEKNNIPINNQNENSTNVNINNNLDKTTKQIDPIILDHSNYCLIQDNSTNLKCNEIQIELIDLQKSSNPVESNNLDEFLRQIESNNPINCSKQIESNNSEKSSKQAESNNSIEPSKQDESNNSEKFAKQVDANDSNDCLMQINSFNNSKQIVLDDVLNIQNDTHEIFVIDDDDEDERLISKPFSNQFAAKMVIKKYRRFNKRKRLFELKIQNSKKIRLI